MFSVMQVYMPLRPNQASNYKMATSSLGYRLTKGSLIFRLAKALRSSFVHLPKQAIAQRA
jgi:hypothetical protein